MQQVLILFRPLQIVGMSLISDSTIKIYLSHQSGLNNATEEIMTPNPRHIHEAIGTADI